jgi:hypothetical protein
MKWLLLASRPPGREAPIVTDYRIEPNTRRCTATGRELRPGERIFTALTVADGRFVRQDFSAEAWTGPPEGAFSFWAGKVPLDTAPKRPVIDDELLMECFERLDGQSEAYRVSFRYVVALLLMRRKRLRFEASAIEHENEVLTLRAVRSGASYQVVNPGLTEEEMAAVQDEVFKLLGWQ